MAAPRYAYLHDRLGSVRLLLDPNASVANRYTYDPYGQRLTAETEETLTNPFQFAGEFYDSHLQQGYNRERSYALAIQRFTSVDPHRGLFKEPLTLHAYLYCLNDPTNRTDPAGRMSMGETTAVTGIGATLTQMSSTAGQQALQFGNNFIGQISRYAFVVKMHLRGLEVHHIVGQGWGNLARFGRGAINGMQNLVGLAPQTHAAITQFFNSGRPTLNFMRMSPELFRGFRTIQHYVSSLPQAEQTNWGFAALNHASTYGNMAGFNPAAYGLIPGM